jgi:hypothetical protein
MQALVRRHELDPSAILVFVLCVSALNNNLAEAGRMTFRR